MDSAISRQIEKFKTGDFSGYQEFYDETVRTAYTMLHTIIPDEQMALAQIPAVYDSMYKNVNELEHTELFYEWMGKQVNEVSLQCVDTGISGDGNVDAEGSGAEAFFDYAVEDEALTITEEQAGDGTFAGRLQQIVDNLTPMEKIVFQKYYYFGERAGDIAAKTGLTDIAVKRILKNTRTAIVSAIEDTASEDTGEQKKYSLKNVPWLWIMFQNNVAGTVGLPYVGLSEFMMGIGGSSGVVSGAAGNVSGSFAGVAGQTPGSMPYGAAGQVPGGMPYGAAGQVSGGMAKSAHGLGRMMGTLGGKITVGVISAAVVVTIGAGVHHALTEKTDSDNAGRNGDGYVETVLPEADTGDTSDQWTQDQPEDTEEDGEKTRFEGMLEEARASVDEYQRTGASYGEDYYMVTRYAKKDCLYTICDVNGDGEDELLFGCWNDESHKVELRNIIYEHTTVCFEGETYYCGDEKIAEYGRNAENYELVIYKHAMEYDEDSYLKILQDGTWRYYNVGYVEAIDTIEENENGAEGKNYKNYDHDFFIRHINDDYFSGYYTEISEAQWNEKQQEYSYTKLEWKPLFTDETILTDDPSIPDSNGRF